MESVVRAILASLLLSFATAACSRDHAAPASPQPAQAHVTMDAARQTALARVPGQVKEEELEEESGRWVYEFDIVSSPQAPATEVVVDATSGQIVSVEQDD